MENLNAIKCRCRGSNSGCLQCYGTGIVADEEPVYSASVETKNATTASPSILDPKYSQRPNKMTLEQAVMAQGVLKGDKKVAHNFANAIRAIKAFRDADPNGIGPHANILLNTIKSSLQFEKPKFIKLMHNMQSISTRTGVSSKDKARLLTIRSALLHGSLRFNAAEVSILDEAFRMAKIGVSAYEPKAFRIQLIAVQDRLKTLETKPSAEAPIKIPAGKTGLIVMCPDDDLSDNQKDILSNKLNERKIDYIYFIGTDLSYYKLKDNFKNLSTLHIKNKNDLNEVMTSTSLGTLKLKSENIEMKI